MTVKTLFIGLDGATFALLDPLMEQGVMPYLHALVEQGGRANLRTIIPPLTPPAWTSLLTGRSPGHHGVFDFFQRGNNGNAQIRLATATDVQTPTIAQIANRHGLTATLLNFPVTFPPPAIDGQVIAGWMPWRQLRLACHPRGLYDELKQLPNFNPRELAMDMEMEAQATEGLNGSDYAGWIDLHIRREQRWHEVVRYLVAEHPSDLLAVLLDGPDKIQHLCWRYLDPALWHGETATDAQRQVHQLCLEYFRQLDAIIAAMVAEVGDAATVVIASDHGFGATSDVLHINTWLAEHGYLAWSANVELDAQPAEALGMGSLTRHMQWIDWSRTTAYASTPTSNGIHIVVADEPGAPGVPRAKYLAFRERLVADLRAYAHPVTGAAVITEVWTREEVFAGAAMELAPDLTLTLYDGGLVSILPSRRALVARAEPVGTHRPLGMLLASGPLIAPGVAVDELSILDVAPLLLWSLDLPIPQDLEGQLPEALIAPEQLQRRPPRSAAAVLASRAVGADEPSDDLAENIILERMRALGYIE